MAAYPVLNAFRHHWNLHPATRALTTSMRRRAQRLSASLESSLGSRSRCFSPTRSAQRLSASLESSLARERQSPERGECSTPFGIIGIFTDCFNYILRRNSECSTPFGIIGIFTRLPVISSRSILRAQRLSASLESSRGFLIKEPRHNRCSTPFGIIGIFTRAANAGQ